MTVPSVPGLPAGLSTRPLTMADAAAVADLVGACELAEDGYREAEPADLLALWSLPGTDLAARSIGVFDGDGLVAWADVRGDEADADVHPDARGRGIGSAILAWAEAHARALGKGSVAQSFSDARTDGAALFEAAGYAPSRHGWLFRLPIEGMPHPRLPDGYAFTDYDHDRDGRVAFGVINTAFNEWRPVPIEDWASWDAYIGGHAFLAGWASSLLVHEDRIVGASIGFDAGPGQDAWIQQLAVAREHRGRGLGSALIHETFARFAERGFTHGGLETDSRTGALAMYRHMGFTVRSSWTRWEKRLE
jgi:GNAT superfamily N-acetyltransferase